MNYQCQGFRKSSYYIQPYRHTYRQTDSTRNITTFKTFLKIKHKFKPKCSQKAVISVRWIASAVYGVKETSFSLDLKSEGVMDSDNARYVESLRWSSTRQKVIK